MVHLQVTRSLTFFCSGPKTWAPFKGKIRQIWGKGRAPEGKDSVPWLWTELTHLVSTQLAMYLNYANEGMMKQEGVIQTSRL